MNSLIRRHTDRLQLIRLLMAITLLISLLNLGASTAQAQVFQPRPDEKIYPGQFCQTAPEFQNSGATAFRKGGGAIENRSNKAVKYYCPIVRDVVKKAIQAVAVQVRDNHLGVSIGCELRGRKRDGTHEEATSVKSLGTGAQVMTLEKTDAEDRGAFLLTCTLPPSTNNGTSGASAIVRYVVVEP